MSTWWARVETNDCGPEFECRKPRTKMFRTNRSVVSGVTRFGFWYDAGVFERRFVSIISGARARLLSVSTFPRSFIIVIPQNKPRRSSKARCTRPSFWRAAPQVRLEILAKAWSGAHDVVTTCDDVRTIFAARFLT